jgi:glycerophosphoryl diester phosphodiesterase
MRIGGCGMVKAFLLTCVCLAPVLEAYGGEMMSAADRLVAAPRVLVIAHRGDSATAPENTLPAFASAVRVGADLIELDYHHSADGVPVVLHDPTLDRTTDADELWQTTQVSVLGKKLDQLRELDAGRWKDVRYTGVSLPTLNDSLDVIQAGSMTLIERKAGDAATCVELLRKKQLVGQVVVQAFDWKYVTDCHELEPALTLAALGTGDMTAERLDELQKTGARVAAWNHKNITAAEIAAIHDRGLKAWCFTVDSPERAQELVAAGIDAIITNVPAQIQRVVEDSTVSAAR